MTPTEIPPQFRAEIILDFTKFIDGKNEILMRMDSMKRGELTDKIRKACDDSIREIFRNIFLKTFKASLERKPLMVTFGEPKKKEKKMGKTMTYKAANEGKKASSKKATKSPAPKKSASKKK